MARASTRGFGDRSFLFQGLLPFMVVVVFGIGVTDLRAEKKIQVFLSSNDRKVEKPKFLKDHVLFLRPNPTLEQKVYVFVHNPSKDKKIFHVKLDSGKSSLEIKTVEVEGEANKRVVFDKVQPEPGSTEDKKPTEDKKILKIRLDFPEFKFQILVEEIQNTQDPLEKVSEEFSVKLLSPKEYLEKPTFKLETKPFAVEIKANPLKFSGPPCPVKIDLKPGRFPGLMDQAPALEQEISENNRKIQLKPSPLKFNDIRDKIGQIYLTVDNLERAFQFDARFGQQDDWNAKLNSDPIVRLNVHPFADPGVETFKATLEVDNYLLWEKATVELGLNPTAVPGQGKVINSFKRARKQEVWVTGQEGDGTLQFSSKVEDWMESIPTKGLAEKCWVIAKIYDENQQIILQDGKEYVDVPVTFLKDPPKKLQITNKPLGGGKLLVKATCEDPPEQIKEVHFCWGKMVGNKLMPDNGEIVPAEFINEGGKPNWKAILDIPEKPGAHDISVEVKNKVNKSSFKSVEYVVQAAPPAANNGTLIVTVVHGGAQKRFLKVTVKKTDILIPNQKAEKEMKAANKDGKYEFKDLPEGTYVVSSSDPNAGTAGELTVEVKKGETTEAALELKLK